MHVVFETRFSFFGSSGWKSAASVDPERLFDPVRLDERLRYFEMITLPSLCDQTDGDFTHMILSSTLMPKAYQRRLRECAKDVLGEARARVMFRAPGKVGRIFRGAVAGAHGDAQVAQVVLDDDDAVACDFVEMLRGLAPVVGHHGSAGADYLFVSFARGLSMGLDGGRPASLEWRYVPYNNQALTLIAPGTSQRNPFLVSHRKVGHRHPSMMLTHLRPYHLRSVHEHNDSRAIRQDKPLRDRDFATVERYFPFLAPHFPDAGQIAPGGIAAE